MSIKVSFKDREIYTLMRDLEWELRDRENRIRNGKAITDSDLELEDIFNKVATKCRKRHPGRGYTTDLISRHNQR